MSDAKGGERFFGPESLRFLRDLARNNNRAWFLEHKARYESEVQAPALRFVEAMGPRLVKLSPHLLADARPFGGSLSRIYRDTRFSKDKRPYKTAVGIHFSHDGVTTGENLPGYFLHIAPGESMVAAGIWHPSLPSLAKIRDAIVGSPPSWGKVLGPGLKIEGESLVRVPAGYDSDHRYSDDLRRKDFYSSHPLSDAEVVSSSFGNRFEATCRTLEPLNKFLAKAVGVPW